MLHRNCLGPELLGQSAGTKSAINPDPNLEQGPNPGSNLDAGHQSEAINRTASFSLDLKQLQDEKINKKDNQTMMSLGY